MTPAAARDDAILAAALFSVDPTGLGGVVLRGGHGLARERWLGLAIALLGAGTPVRRMPAHIEDDRLLGGLDLPASLAAGRPVAQRGLIAESDGGVVLLPMAERIEAGLAARLAAALDNGEIVVERDGLDLRLPARIGLIALDEGLTAEERPPDALTERLAFHVAIEEVRARAAAAEAPDAATIAAARIALADVDPPDGAIVEALCAAAKAGGQDSMRGPLLALRAARAHAALAGRRTITAEDAVVAARLVLAPRMLGEAADAEPEAAAQAEASPAEPEESAGGREPNPSSRGETDIQPDAEADRVLAAVQAVLPEVALSAKALEGGTRTLTARTRGAGARGKSANRGRPVGSRPGAPRGGARLHLVETLRAAVPWQRLRTGGVAHGPIQVRREDFRIRRYLQRLESTTIIAVDASGSAARQRLAEAKGAVELLLAKAYVSRAQVALIAFRGMGAELLLAPTRSLARAKSRLAELPGGGGTPLAAGVMAAVELGLAERAKAHTPLLVFLTDGRANIARDGALGRAAAETDAMEAARQVRAAALAAVFIDTSARPAPDADRFARAMGATYASLPYVDANAVLGVVGEHRQARGLRRAMITQSGKPDWDSDGRDWPNRAASRFVWAGGLRWHVQFMGQGPSVLLLHGAGAATHTWRDVAPMLAEEFSLIMPDLPGHGFTGTPDGEGLSLVGMARLLQALLDELGARPTLVVGHSAGAAIALRLRLDGAVGEGGVVSLNGALRPFPGAAGHILPAMAKILSLNPLANQLFAWRAASAGAVTQLIEGMGSRIDPIGIDCYARLLRKPGHIAGALGMMARWDLHPLVADLPRFSAPLTLVAAQHDRAVPPSVAEQAMAAAPRGMLIRLSGLGHLAHEEAPHRACEIIRAAAAGGSSPPDGTVMTRAQPPRLDSGA